MVYFVYIHSSQDDVCTHSAPSGNDRLRCFRDHSLLWTIYVDIVHYLAMIGFGVSETTPPSFELCMDIVHYRAMIDFGVSETTPPSLNYVCRHSALSAMIGFGVQRPLPRLVIMYADMVHYRAMIDFGAQRPTLVLWTMYVDKYTIGQG